MPGWGPALLTYEGNQGNYKNIFIMTDWVNLKDSNPLKDSLIGNISDLRTTPILIVTKRKPFEKTEGLWFILLSCFQIFNK